MTSKDFKPILHRILQSTSNLDIREVRRFQAERFVFTIQVNKVRHKVFQVIFETDGSLYVTFPYFDINEGIVSTGTLSIFSNITKVNLEHKGKVTSRRIKYSHHPSGQVHISQAGKEKVKTEIKKSAMPLNSSEGHLFTVNIQGFSHFEIDQTDKDHLPSKKRTVLNFSFDESPIVAAKFVCRWYKENSLLNRSRNKYVGPTSTGISPQGNKMPTFFIGPLQGRLLSDHVLTVNCEGINPLDKDKDAILNFIGGFEAMPKRIAELPTFLCINYPIPNYEKLAKQIGTIDLIGDD